MEFIDQEIQRLKQEKYSGSLDPDIDRKIELLSKLEEYFAADEVALFGNDVITYSETIAKELAELGFKVVRKELIYRERTYSLDGELIEDRPIDTDEPSHYYLIQW